VGVVELGLRDLLKTHSRISRRVGLSFVGVI